MLKSIAFGSFLLIFLTACGPQQEAATEPAPEPTTEPTMNETETTSERPLESQLEAKKAGFLARAAQQKIDDYEQGIVDVSKSGVLENALKTGDQAPDFTLQNAVGNSVQLTEVLKDGPVVLIWYRGGWCPYCNITLHYLQERLPDFQKYNASLLALSPEQPDKSLDTKEKNELEFEVLSDLDNEVARAYGVVYKLPETIANYYENGFGLSDYNGNDKSELPLAATYLIDQNGVIQYAFLDADYRERAEPADILATLEQLQSAE